jgi:DNA-binding MarR family transcriptional regulator
MTDKPHDPGGGPHEHDGAADGFDIERLDEVIHGRVRLGVMAQLIKTEVADFNELKAVLNVTQGNLSIHLRKLEEAGYVEIEKGYLGRKPRTRVRLTGAGRKAFTAYLSTIEQLLKQLR